MTREEAINAITQFIENYAYGNDLIGLKMAIEALYDRKPSRTWIAKNEYRRGWHDAITKALSEVLKIHVGNEIFDMVQKETLIGLGLSMDSALGAEPYSETEESYPEPDRPHGEWKPDGTCSECGVYSSLNKDATYFCPNCGADMREEGDSDA